MNFLQVFTFTLILYQLGRVRGLDFECRENVTYVLDENYPCQCMPDATSNSTNVLSCDLSRCPPKPYVKQSCSLGDTWKKDCNQCWCRMIGTVCTDEKCTHEPKEV